MAAYVEVEVIQVNLWGALVGAIARDPSTGYYVFEYDPDWMDRQIEIAPLHMPTTRGPLHSFPSLPTLTYHGLPAVFADSLPDKFGNAIVTAALARQGVPESRITPLDRLAYLGSRGTGALEYHPARHPKATTSTAVKLNELVTVARSALRGTLNADDEAEAALQQLIAVGTSAGGARAKAVVAWNRETNELRSGQLDASDGFEHWLIKLDGMGADNELGRGAEYGRVEYAYSLMARAAGIDMADCSLLEENGRAHFMTRRFDRDGSQRIHMQTLCAVAHLDFNQIATHDYAQYLQTIDRLDLGPDARAEGFRRMVFNVWAANCDDHTKNLSFLMDDDGRWRLAPGYDITHAYNPDGEWTSSHQMAVNGKFWNITLDDVADLGDRYAVPDWKGIVADVERAVDRWPEFAEEAGCSAEKTALVAADIAAQRPS